MLYTNTISNNIKKTSWINSKKYLILHHTWGWSYSSNLSLLQNNNHLASWHYMIWFNWEICKYWEESDILWHAWDNSDVKLNWISFYNPVSIWVEVVSDSNWKWFTNIQKQKTYELLRDIIKRNNIPKSNFLRHKDITKRKVDIDDSFWNTEFDSFDQFKDFIYKDLFTSNSNMSNTNTKITNKGYYENIFSTNYWKSSIFNDLDWAISKCIKADWSINSKEFFYLIQIWLERLSKKIK